MYNMLIRVCTILLLAFIMLILFAPHATGQSEILWSKTYGGSQDETFQDIYIDGDNLPQVIGYSQSTRGEFLKSEQGLYDMQICELKANGTINWSENIGGANNDLGKSILVSQNKTWIGGLTYSNDNDIPMNLGSGDIVFGNLDESHQLASVKVLGGNNLDQIIGLKTQPDGTIILVANTNSTDVLQTGVGGATDILVCRLLPDGTIIWQTTLGSNGVDKAADLAINSRGDIIIVGSTFSSDFLDFKKGIKDGFVVCINSNGNKIWGKRYGNGNYSNFVACDVDHQDNILVTGTQGQISTVNSGINGVYNDDIWVLKLDDAGEESWRKSFGGKENDYATDLISTLDGGVLITGNTVSFDGIVTSNFGGKDAFALKLNSLGSREWSKGYGGSGDDVINKIAQDRVGQYWLVGQSTSSDIHIASNRGGNDAWVLKLKGKAPQLNVELGNPVEACEGEQIFIDATIQFCDCQYIWSDGSNDAKRTLTAVSNTTLNVTVTDNSGSSTSDGITITVYKKPKFDLAGTDISCASGSDGMVEVTQIDAVFPLSYEWNLLGAGSNGVLNNLSAGGYSLTLSDANNCTQTKEISLTEPSPMVINAETQNAICEGSNGGIQLAVNGGNEPYNYIWEDGFNGSSISNIAAGTYAITVTDSNGCNENETIVVNQSTDDFELEFAVSLNACAGLNEGSIEILNTNRISSYQWSTGANTEMITSLFSGLYTLYYTTEDGCDGSQSFTISEPAPLEVETIVVNNDCASASEGSIHLQISGGTGSYTMAWENGEVESTIENLSAGLYAVTISDRNGCSIIIEEEVQAPQNIEAGDAAVQSISCLGAEDGAISLNPIGGAGGYAYTWSNGSNAPSLTDLIAGIYTVTITDMLDCSTALSFEVEDAQASPSFLANTINPSCKDIANGSVSFLSTTLMALEYHWEDGFIGNTRDNLSAGIYGITASNSSGCSTEQNFELTEPAELDMRFIIEKVTCYNGADGTVSVIPSGGTAPYMLVAENNISEILDFTVEQQIENLSAGLYLINLEDANGCRLGLPLIVSQPDSISYAAALTNPSCFESNDGSIDLDIDGGTGDFMVSWADGAENELRNNLSGGVFQVTIEDESGCTAVSDFELEEPDPIQIEASVIDASCFGSMNGSIVTSVQGGTGKFTYFWGGDLNSNVLEGIHAGIYTVEVEDENGCQSESSFQVFEPEALEVDVIFESPISGENSGRIELDITGGTSPYSVLWDNGAEGAELTGLDIGTYRYEILDGNGCSLQGSILLETINSSIDLKGISDLSIFPNPANEQFFLTTEKTYRDVQLRMYNSLGQLVLQKTYLQFPNGVASHIRTATLPAGVYFVTLINESHKGVYKIVIEH